LITAKYCGAKWRNSARQPASGTSIRKTPLSKLKALVRAATADPHASGHASTGACGIGARRKLPVTIFSRTGAIGSTGDRF
jgi:hypothetical protein